MESDSITVGTSTGDLRELDVDSTTAGALRVITVTTDGPVSLPLEADRDNGIDLERYERGTPHIWIDQTGSLRFDAEGAPGAGEKGFPEELPVQYRVLKVDREAVNMEDRTVEIAMSSETPVPRWWGIEILDHSRKAVRLGRLRAGGAVLLHHDTWDPLNHVGVVESVRIDPDRIMRGVIRFGSSERAEMTLRDIRDGIRKWISIGYRIIKVVLQEEKEDGPSIYRVTEWEPLEVSPVPIPADATVGVGRGARSEQERELYPVRLERRSETMPGETTQDRAGAREPQSAPAAVAAPAAPAVDVRAERNQAREQELERVQTILQIGEDTKQRELASQYIKEGKPVDEFRAAVIQRMIGAEGPIRQAPIDPKLGLNEKERKRFSFLKLIRARMEPSNPSYQEDAAFELECSREFRKLRGGEFRGDVTIPPDILCERFALPTAEVSERFPRASGGRRDLSVGTDTAGGYTVATTLESANFIELLRNNTVGMQLGRTITGLVGDVAFPKLTGGATAYWVGEGSPPTESTQTFGQVAATPKTVGGMTDLTRKLIMQSSIDCEALVKSDLAQVLGIAADLAIFHGTGVTQPTGIEFTTGIGVVAMGTNGLAPTWAKYVEFETTAATANAATGKLAYVGSAKVRGALKTIQKGTNLPFIWNDAVPEAPVNGYPFYVTNQIKQTYTKGTHSTADLCATFFGNWNDLLICMWSGLDMLVDPFTQGAEGNVRIRLFQSLDSVVRHPESFVWSYDQIC